MSDLEPSVHLSDPEWQLFLKRRREMFEDMVQTLRMGQEFKQYAGLLGGMGGSMQVAPTLAMPQQDVGPTFNQLRQLQRQAGGTYEQQRAEELQMPVDEREHRKLIGAARFYGIADSERMPTEQLRREVESHRDYMAERRMADGGGVLAEIYDTAVQTYVTAGIGAVQGFVNAAKHIPFLGDAIENSRTIGEYQLGLDSITEAVTAGMTDEERGAYEQFAVPVSRFTGWAAFQGMAARALTKTPWIGGISNPFLRGAAYGTVFGVVTEGGNDDLSPAQRAAAIATSGLLGGAGEVVLPGLLRRLEAWRLRGVMEAPLRPQGMADDIVDAELVGGTPLLPWAGGADDAMAPLLRQLPPGPRPPAPLAPELPPSSMPPGVLQVQPGITSFPRGQQLPPTEGGLQPTYEWQNALAKFRASGIPDEGAPGISVYPADDAGGGLAKHFTVAARDEEGQLIGVVLVRNAGARFDYETGEWGRVPGGTITDLAVAPHARGRGVATSMYKELEQASGIPISSFHSSPTEAGAAFRNSFLRNSGAEGASFSKQAALMESPDLPQLLRQPSVDDADVAAAAVRTNPGQVSVIQNVGDVGKTVRRFLQDYLPNGVGPQDFRVVRRQSSTVIPRGPNAAVQLEGQTYQGRTHGQVYEQLAGQTGRSIDELVVQGQDGFINIEGEFITRRQTSGFDPVPTRFDILVSDGLPISNKMVKDYETYGMFSGMKATAPGGQEVIVSKLGAEVSLVRTQGGSEFEVATATLQPGRTSAISLVAPEAYVEMKGYALSRMADEAIRSNLPIETVDWFGDEFASQLPRYVDEFLDLRGVEGDAARGAYTSLLTELRLQEFRSLEPELFQRADEIGREAARRQALSGYTPSVAEVAEPNGLLWEPQPGGGGILRDGPSGEILFTARSDEEGYAFLQSFQREPLDLSPATTVPVELATGAPGAPSAGLTAGPMFRGRMRELVDDGERELARLEAEFADLGGGGGGVPPIGPGFTGGAGALPPPGGPGAGFQRIPTLEFHKLNARFSNALLTWFEPMRGYAARVTEMMHAAGVPRTVNYWEDVTKVQNAVAVANAEVEPWIIRAHEGALSKIRHRRIRNGTVFQIAQMPWEQALHAMQNAGFTAREVEGMAGLRQLFIDAGREYGVDMTRFFGEYMPHVRAARSREEAFSILNRYEFRGPARWFAEEIRNGGLDYLETNAEVLLYKWFRGASFSRHVQPHTERMAAQWANDPAIPEKLRVVTANWLSLVTNGFTPGGSRIGEGLAGIFQSFGMPIAAADVQRFVRAFMGNTTRAWLGWRPHVVLRETINPLMASIRLGNFGDLAYTMQRYGRDPGFREAIMDEALRGGWVLRAPFASAMQDFSSTPVMQGLGLNQPEGPFSPGQLQVREGIARGGDVVRDAMDRMAPRGLGVSPLEPLRAVDKVNELGRALSGFAAKRSFLRALQGYNAALQEGGAELNMQPLFAQLLVESGASNLHWPFQRALIERVKAGDYEGAANMFANEGANQLGRMGQLDYPVAMHSAGEWGRVGLHLGNFAHQYQAMMREGLAGSGLAPEFGGTRLSKAKAGVRFAGYQAILHASLGQAGATSGWNFGKWMWAGAIMWGGSPLVWALLDEMRGLNASAKEASGQRVSPQETVAMQSDDLMRIIGASVNPAQGLFSTVEGAVQMAGTTNPLEATANFLVTGQKRDPAAVRYFNDPGNPGNYGMEDLFERRWGTPAPPLVWPPLPQQGQGYGGGYPSPPGSGAMP